MGMDRGGEPGGRLKGKDLRGVDAVDGDGGWPRDSWGGARAGS